MTTHAELGMNRTGIATSPRLSHAMVEGNEEFAPLTDGDECEIAHERADYAREADPLGSVPPPLTAKGMAKTAGTALTGESPTQFIDKLGERLAFERTGTRLYEGLLSKYDALGGFDGGPTRDEIEHILNEEFEHFTLLEQAVTKMGADPTVMTPSADLHATLSRGILEVMVDPRTTLPQCLEAVLLAELADNDCWKALGELATEAGQSELANVFARALTEEAAHLVNVRRWIAAAQGRT